jgi:cell division protein ZapA
MGPESVDLNERPKEDSMHPDKNTASETYEVQVAGLPLRLKSSHDENTVQELIDLVDAKVKEAMSSNSSISFQKALLLASLHVAEDLVFLKRAVRSRLDALETKAKGVLSELGSSPINRLTTDQ